MEGEMDYQICWIMVWCPTSFSQSIIFSVADQSGSGRLITICQILHFLTTWNPEHSSVTLSQHSSFNTKPDVRGKWPPCEYGLWHDCRMRLKVQQMTLFSNHTGKTNSQYLLLLPCFFLPRYNVPDKGWNLLTSMWHTLTFYFVNLYPGRKNIWLFAFLTWRRKGHVTKVWVTARGGLQVQSCLTHPIQLWGFDSFKWDFGV